MKINNPTPISNKIISNPKTIKIISNVILEAYRDINRVKDILIQIYHDDINIKVILKERPSDRQLSELISRQLIIHKKFNYSFSFNFEYIPFDLYK